MLTVTQEFNVNTNNTAHYSMDNDPHRHASQDTEDHLTATQIARLLHNPEMGVHARAYESLTGWAVEIIHNTITHGDFLESSRAA